MFKRSLIKKSAAIFSIMFVLSQLPGLSYSNICYASTSSYSWNNKIPEKVPASGKSNGKLILFDNSHDETSGAADWVLDGGFSDFADDLVTNGYTVREYRGVDKNQDGVIRYYDDRTSENVDKNEEVITYDSIKDADAFVMAEPNRPFTTAEQSALKQFVDSGKGIYFIADHYNSDRNKNTWDSTEVYDGYNRSNNSSYNIGGSYGDLRNPGDATKGWLAENFGVRFRFNAIDLKSGFSGIKSASESESITSGVQPILMAAGSTLSIVDGSKAKGIVYLSSTDNPVKWSSAADKGIYFGGEDEGAYVAISKPSKGKAAFIGDSSPLEDDTPKYMNEETGKVKSTHAGYKSTGNAAKLSVNIINWLCNQESYVGFDGINHTKGINTPTPMAEVEKSQTGTEPWSTPSYNPWNTDTFAYGSYNAPQGSGSSPDTPTEVTTIDEGFNNVTGSSSSISSGIPIGWTFSSGMGLYTTTGNYGAASPAIKLQATNNQITTPKFSLSASASLLFWVKGNSTDSKSHLLVEKYNGTSWSTIEDIKPISTTALTKTYTLESNITQVRFTYTKSEGNLALDDVKIK
jgi:hypothetical protein